MQYEKYDDFLYEKILILIGLHPDFHVVASVICVFIGLNSSDFSAEGRQFLNDLFRIDPTSTLTESTDSDFLVEWIWAAMDYMAMVNYPYPSNFLQPLPGWPVKARCLLFFWRGFCLQNYHRSS